MNVVKLDWFKTAIERGDGCSSSYKVIDISDPSMTQDEFNKLFETGFRQSYSDVLICSMHYSPRVFKFFVVERVVDSAPKFENVASEKIFHMVPDDVEVTMEYLNSTKFLKEDPIFDLTVLELDRSSTKDEMFSLGETYIRDGNYSKVVIYNPKEPKQWGAFYADDECGVQEVVWSFSWGDEEKEVLKI
ncbi:hypothetical protein [Cohnella yongneupensis]|uniref:Uncharacterized protein n=1 Tax=Cohnella yongneupensis TaxID=425006 RepID=A0ABW0QZJ3_9BACL